MNHVIEHVHDPVAAVCEAHALLRPGGRLWLATPNLGSYLAGKFKENWFPLDPPRHLTLFHCEVLARIIEKAGFKSMALMPPLFEGRFVSEASYRISRRRPPFSKSKMPNSFDDWVRESNVIAISQRDKAESITLVATKDE
jgi:2-polyprenyl-3-methyl-5-hydroxy-6-metoxy-1,4-benzoquinol methylase